MRNMSTLAAASVVCTAVLTLSVLPAQSQSVAMAKFESGCSGDSDFVIREMGYPDNVIRFTLASGQKVHFQIPMGSTYSMSCGGWPTNNASWSTIRYE
jgi:hypothetical protein